MWWEERYADIPGDVIYEYIEDKLVNLYAYKCPKCGAEFYTLEENVKYCPHCGATPVPDEERTRHVSLYDP